MGVYVGFAGTLPSVSTKMQRVTGTVITDTRGASREAGLNAPHAIALQEQNKQVQKRRRASAAGALQCEVSSTECAGQSISVDVVPDDRMVLSSARSRANICTTCADLASVVSPQSALPSQ